MPQTRQFTPTSYLASTDAIVIDRVGQGTLYILAQNFSGLSGQLITASGLTLNPGLYWLKSSLGAFTGTLPQVSTVAPGSGVSVGDIDYDAGVNNYTVNAYAGDHILDHGSLVTSYAVNISNAITLFVANSSVAPYTTSDSWTVIIYGA